MSEVLVKCIHCGNEETVNFGYCLGNGWPKCCGYTMRLMTKAKYIDIDSAVGNIVNHSLATSPSSDESGDKD